jgi:hypothetical protein
LVRSWREAGDAGLVSRQRGRASQTNWWRGSGAGFPGF